VGVLYVGSKFNIGSNQDFLDYASNVWMHPCRGAAA
jgi:hypothetical protein